jgi:hypothetical protein
MSDEQGDEGSKHLRCRCTSSLVLKQHIIIIIIIIIIKFEKNTKLKIEDLAGRKQ